MTLTSVRQVDDVWLGKEHLRMTVYVDVAATTPVSERVAKVVWRYLVDDFGNAGSRTHQWGTDARRAVSDARTRLATRFEASPSELIFTSGATESNNLVVAGLARSRPGPRHIVSVATEHKAVLEPLHRLEREGYEVDLVRPGPTGVVSTEQILRRLRPDTLLVSVMHVNNETGVLAPIDELAEYLVQTETLLHVDAAQGFMKDQDRLRCRADFISISAHKIGGPKGVGALVLRRRGWEPPPLEPLIVGGGQERGLRAGTLPVALIMGFAEAADEFDEKREDWRERCLVFRNRLLEAVSELGGEVNGNPLFSVPHILNFSFSGIDSEALLVSARDVFGMSTGSACTSSKHEPSHVLRAMDLSDDRVRGAVRMSWDHDCSDSLDGFVKAIERLHSH